MRGTRYLVKYVWILLWRYFLDEKVFFSDKTNISISRLWVKKIILHYVGGSHPISWRPKEKDTSPSNKKEFCLQKCLWPWVATASLFWVSSLPAFPADFRSGASTMSWASSLKYISVPVSPSTHTQTQTQTHTHTHTHRHLDLFLWRTLTGSRVGEVMVPTLKKLFCLKIQGETQNMC